MSDMVYAVYSIPKSPEYRLEKLFKTKDGAKEYIIKQKFAPCYRSGTVFDIQVEEIGK